MSCLRHVDISIEMLELGQELLAEIRQQLVYYRASVYNDETANQINAKVAEITLLADLLGDESMREALTDYEVLRQEVTTPIPGECHFSKRVSLLLGTLDQAIRATQGRLQPPPNPEQDQQLADSVRKHRHKLLDNCDMPPPNCALSSIQWLACESAPPVADGNSTSLEPNNGRSTNQQLSGYVFECKQLFSCHTTIQICFWFLI